MKLVVNEYLARIGYSGSRRPDLETLQKLKLAHLRSVPFENLSIHIGERIRLDYSWLYEKIVVRNRGGFCYELNGLFGRLLQELGFEVTMLSAGVRPEDGAPDAFGPEFDHMVLKVDLEKPWLVDVGFGEAYTEPLALQTEEEQTQGQVKYRITLSEDDTYIYWRKQVDWEPNYRFSLIPRQLQDYAGMCHYHQTDSRSPFTKRWVVTHLSKSGRETLYQDGNDFRFLTTTDQGKHRITVQGFENARIMLADIFGIPEATFERPRKRKTKNQKRK